MDTSAAGTEFSNIATPRVLLVDTHRTFTDALGAFLDTRTEFTVLAKSEDLYAAGKLVAEVRPDLLIIEPDVDGTWNTDSLGALAIDAQASNALVAVLTRRADGELARDALAAGVSAFLRKSSSLDEIVDAIRHVMRGQVIVDRGSVMPVGGASLLSTVEIETIRWLANGASQREMSHEMHVSESTIRLRLTSVYRKLGVKNGAQAAAYAVWLGLVNPLPSGEPRVRYSESRLTSDDSRKPS